MPPLNIPLNIIMISYYPSLFIRTHNLGERVVVHREGRSEQAVVKSAFPQYHHHDPFSPIQYECLHATRSCRLSHPAEIQHRQLEIQTDPSFLLQAATRKCATGRGRGMQTLVVTFSAYQIQGSETRRRPPGMPPPRCGSQGNRNCTSGATLVRRSW